MICTGGVGAILGSRSRIVQLHCFIPWQLRLFGELTYVLMICIKIVNYVKNVPWIVNFSRHRTKDTVISHWSAFNKKYVRKTILSSRWSYSVFGHAKATWITGGIQEVNCSSGICQSLGYFWFVELMESKFARRRFESKLLPTCNHYVHQQVASKEM